MTEMAKTLVSDYLWGFSFLNFPFLDIQTKVTKSSLDKGKSKMVAPEKLPMKRT